MKLDHTLCLVSLLMLSACEKQNALAGDPNFPLHVCVVSGEKLGSMGARFVHQYEGKEVQFCCKGCLKDFNKEPEKYLAKIADATKGR